MAQEGDEKKKISIYFECYFVFSFRIYSFVMLLADRQTERDIFASATRVMEREWRRDKRKWKCEWNMNYFHNFTSISNNWENIPFSPRYNIYSIFFSLLSACYLLFFSFLWRLTCDYKSSTEKMQANNFDANNIKKRATVQEEGYRGKKK